MSESVSDLVLVRSLPTAACNSGELQPTRGGGGYCNIRGGDLRDKDEVSPPPTISLVRGGGLTGSPTVARPTVREVIALPRWLLQDGGLQFQRGGSALSTSEIPLRTDGTRPKLSAAARLAALVPPTQVHNPNGGG